MENLEKKIDDLTKAFNEFVLNTSVELALQKQSNKWSARINGLIGSSIPVLIILGIWAIKG